MVQIEETTWKRDERWLHGAYGRMRYWVSFPQHGLPVVLIHGYGSVIEHWRRVMPALSQSHTWYALDLYGFGYSAVLPPRAPLLQVWAEQLSEFLTRVVGEPAIVVANSLGGSVAAHLCHTSPHLVRGLVLVDTTGLPSVVSLLSARKRAFYLAAQTPMVGEMIKTALGSFGGEPGVRQFLHALYYRREQITPELVQTLTGPFRRSHMALFCLRVLRAFETFTLDIQPGDVTVPTLLVWGQEDPALPPIVAERLQQTMFPQAEIQIIPESGHCPFDETPAAFCDIVIPWINQFRGDGSP